MESCNVVRRLAVSSGHESPSSPMQGESRAVNLDQQKCLCSADWWDEVFEATDLKKFIQCVGDCQNSAKRAVSHKDGSIKRFKETVVVVNDSSASDFSSAGSEVECALPLVNVDSNASLGQHHSITAALDSLGRSCNNTALYPSRLKILAAKIALNSGKQHLSTSGKVRRARHLKSPCHSRCRRCQVPRLSEAERHIVFDRFWSLKHQEQQWMFIFNCVKLLRPKRKFAKKGSKGEKCWSRVYHFNIDGEERKVCKTMFKNTLCVCDSWVDSALSHFVKGAIVPDLRGRRKL